MRFGTLCKRKGESGWEGGVPGDGACTVGTHPHTLARIGRAALYARRPVERHTHTPTGLHTYGDACIVHAPSHTHAHAHTLTHQIHSYF